jgi:methylmalonyl-CoA mutase N-terminal domain/subunit
MLSAIESGWVQNEIQDAAYRYQRSIENKERVVVGVNEFRLDEESSIPIHTVDPALEAAQTHSLRERKKARRQAPAVSALARLETAARGDDNLMPFIIEAVEAEASIGEISDTFRRIHGEYQETLAV